MYIRISQSHPPSDHLLMFRCGGNHSGYHGPASKKKHSTISTTTRTTSLPAPGDRSLVPRLAAQLAWRRHHSCQDPQARPANTDLQKFDRWNPVGLLVCYIMLYYVYMTLYTYYIYISLNVVDWYSILGRHCRSSLAGQTRLRWKMSFQHVSKSFPVCPVSPLACMITCSRFSVCVWFSIRLTCRIWLRTPLSLACGGHVAGSPTGKMILLSVGQEVCWYVLINDLPVRFSYCRSKTRGVPTSSVIIEHQPTTWFDMCGSEISTSPTIFGWWVQAQRTFALRHQFHKGLGGWIFNEVISVTTSMLQFRSVADSQVLKFLYPTQMSCIVVAGGNRSIWTMY